MRLSLQLVISPQQRVSHSKPPPPILMYMVHLLEQRWGCNWTVVPAILHFLFPANAFEFTEKQIEALEIVAFLHVIRHSYQGKAKHKNQFTENSRVTCLSICLFVLLLIHCFMYSMDLIQWCFLDVLWNSCWCKQDIGSALAPKPWLTNLTWQSQLFAMSSPWDCLCFIPRPSMQQLKDTYNDKVIIIPMSSKTSLKVNKFW